MSEIKLHLPSEDPSRFIHHPLDQWAISWVHCNVCGEPLGWFPHFKTRPQEELDEIAETFQLHVSPRHTHKGAPT